MSQIKVDSIVPTGGLSAGADGGGIIQVASTIKRDTASTASTTFGVISGLTCTITPTSTSSKILIIANVTAGFLGNRMVPLFTFGRGGTVINDSITQDGTRPNSTATSYPGDYGNGGDSGYNNLGLSFLDSPASTSALTYSVMWRTGSASYTMYLNRNARFASYDHASTSAITVMEVSG